MMIISGEPGQPGLPGSPGEEGIGMRIFYALYIVDLLKSTN